MGPMCPRRGRDGQVGPPGAKTIAVVMLWSLIIKPWQFSGCGGWWKKIASLGMVGGENKNAQVHWPSWGIGRTDGGTKKRNVQVPPLGSWPAYAASTRGKWTGAPEHVPHHPFTWRLRSLLTLVPRYTLWCESPSDHLFQPIKFAPLNFHRSLIPLVKRLHLVKGTFPLKQFFKSSKLSEILFFVTIKLA